MTLNTKRIAVYEQVTIQNGEPAKGGEALAGFIFMDCKVTDQMRMMEHPVENGAKITDYEVREPVQISLTASLSTADQSAASGAYNELKQLYTGGAPLMVKTSADVYGNMLVSGMPYDELPQNYDRVVFNLALKEVITVNAQHAPLAADQVRNPSDASTVSTGQKQARHSKSGASETDRRTGAFAK